MIRIVGGAGGATGLATAGLVGPGLMSPADAARPRKIRARLDRSTYQVGEVMVLRFHEKLVPGRKVRVVDSSGLRWKRIKRNDHRQVWTATATRSGVSTVTVKVLWPNGRTVKNRRYRDRVSYRVLSKSLSGGAPLIGMSASPSDWDQRVSEVGPGLGARRIFADLAAGATSQIKLVEASHKAGMLPVISYKVGGDIAGAVAGSYNAVAEQAAAKLASYGLPTAVTFWHEPHTDMTTAQYVAASKQLLPIFKRGELRVGPLLNGFLLDRQQDVFGEYCPDELFDIWDWVGLDTYQLGSIENPGKADPGTRITALSAYVQSRGYDHPLGVGEYNGFTAQAIASAGEALLTTPNVWFGCVWNSVLERDFVLSGDRLAAFQATLADPRAGKPQVTVVPG
jgi:hypothetical protein